MDVKEESSQQLRWNERKLSKKQRRIVQKQLKLRNTLACHENIISRENSTRNLVVANGGLSNGVQREQLWSLFAPYGSITDIVMKPHKPYAFVSFSSIDDAVLAVNELNGELLSHGSNHPLSPDPRLYMLYVAECPDEPTLPYAGSEFLPPGLTVINDFITAEEEEQLLATLDWTNAESASLKHRRVMHYGYKFDYTANAVDRTPLPWDIPVECLNLMERLRQQSLISQLPDQMTVNQYQPGQGIPPHVDTHSSFHDTIVIVNLQSQVVMEFRKHDDRGDQRVDVLLPRFSVALMSGDARYEWTHGITPHSADVVRESDSSHASPRLTLMKRGVRTSLTFRNVQHSAVCHCKYVSQCDSQRDSCKVDKSHEELQSVHTTDDQTLAAVANDVNASHLEAEHVHKVYERIASHFSSTRHSPWPHVVDFINQIPVGSLVADAGCGNGKYLGINPNIYMVGCDRSSKLCSICQSRGHESLICDCLSLPLRTAAFDAVLCIAVVHHLSTELRRQKALSEVARLLRIGGRACVYVWAVEQEKDNVKSKYLRPSKAASSQHFQSATSPITGEVPDLPVHVNGTAFKAQDLLVPWHLKKKNGAAERREQELDAPIADSDKVAKTDEMNSAQILHRYYHTFTDGELRRLCDDQVAGVRVLNSYYDQGNWCTVIERTADVDV